MNTTQRESKMTALMTRMRMTIGTLNHPAVQIVKERSKTPIERAIEAHERHIAEIKADKRYDKVDDRAWIAEIRKQIKSLKRDLKDDRKIAA